MKRTSLPLLRRREFIALLGGGAAAWPLAARAQQGRVWQIAFLHSLLESDAEVQVRVAAFGQAVAALGWTNRNMRVEHRFAGGDITRIQAYVADTVSAKPDVIVASSTPIVVALKQATQTIPIVFVIVNDPVGQGFVANLARPGGNVTGFSFIDFPLIGKWLQLLKEIAPATRRITFMFNPQSAHSLRAWRPARCASRRRRVQLVTAADVSGGRVARPSVPRHASAESTGAICVRSGNRRPRG
jgi:putative tryptophan/tyrosine transport system substrate-binding protein